MKFTAEQRVYCQIFCEEKTYRKFIHKFCHKYPDSPVPTVLCIQTCEKVAGYRFSV
jgi:hypothetical protein